MAALAKVRITVEEYLALDEQSDHRLEYIAGEIVAMAGASRAHNLINYNLTMELGTQLRKRPCEAYASEMRVHIPSTGDYTYPDQVVVCGEPEFLPTIKPDTLLNPTVIIEVLSPTTASLDRGPKFDSYRDIDSLQDYILVAQHTRQVMHYTRQKGGWAMTEARDLDAVLFLPSIGCSLPLAEIYAKVSFSA